MQRNCSDPKSIFGDFDTLHACYDEFGGSPSNSTFARLVNACVNDYCNSPFPWIGGCAAWQGPTGRNFAVRETAFFLSRFTYFDSPAACEGVVGDPSSDIAGPGVYTSYMIQMAFVLFLWFLIQVSSAIIKISRHLRLPERPVLRAWRHRFPTGARLLHRIFHRHHAVLKHTLIEFHEAQCFFLIAAQLAILIAQGDAAVLGSYTLRSALQNMTTSYLVSTIGILPVVIAMWSLQMAHESCVCTMLLSVTTVALSEAAMYKSKGLSVRGQMATVDYRGWPASCGGHAPPLIYCGLATEGTGPIAFPSAFLKASNPICLTIFGVTVLLWQCGGSSFSKWVREEWL
ncbi:hypothetical protein LEL_04438 [Akanthomyces lecanii RCEF 1005]|uniref:Uncharacterized protein n=1 Tax=Akanthomyces lecanii RCEF 1005 TaxID=1081108 RepID=A0A168HD08_CORDF|nr:hypothetical protein LEL_04438 [Akanthomyces lecanii RCEF 1005]